MLNSALEKISQKQLSIINQLWLSKAEISIHKSNKFEVKARRRGQLQELRKILPDIDNNVPVADLTKQWWEEEIKWLSNLVDPAGVEAMLCYRYLIIFYKNLTQCPFTETIKPMFGKEKTVADSKDYELAVQDAFDESLQVSLSHLSRTEDAHIKRVLPTLQKLQGLNLDKNLYSARHKLMDKDIAILKGVVVGGAVGIAASIFVGPVIGTWIGELAGFSGAAATSYGLALLGGGSIASGGFGMAGGTALVGVISGSYQGFTVGKSEVEIELFGLATSAKNLPILLALGRDLKELGCRDLAFDIRRHITGKKTELDMHLIEMERNQSKDAKHSKAIEALKDNIQLYEQANEMASAYDWMSLYDAIKWVK
jgi:hypothetical protein